MAILIDDSTKVLIQGITGRQGQASSRAMLAYGTRVVAGVTPGKGGRRVNGLPVFNSPAEAVRELGPLDASVTFVPAPLVKGAVIDALEAGIKLIQIPVDRMPAHDFIEVVHRAERLGAQLIGPNSGSVVSPGQAMLGMGSDPDTLARIFTPGPVGVMSRSGGMTATLAYYLSRAGLGQSTVISVGGDAIIGRSIPELLPLFQADEQTKAVAIFGEIGTTQEERTAEMIRRGEFTKPMVAYIAGSAAPEGTRFSHSAAIINGSSGSARGKIEALREVGVEVIVDIVDLPEAMARVLTNG